MNIFVICIALCNFLSSNEVFANRDLPNEIQERVDIVTYSKSLLPHQENLAMYKPVRSKFDVRFRFNLYEYVQNFSGDSHNLKKIVFLDYCEDLRMLTLPKHKMICFKWEAVKALPRFYDYYYRVYTFDDDLVDKKKFFKFYYPVLRPMLAERPSFHEKNLCAMIVSNWIPERVEIVDFFNLKPQDSLHIYGRRAPEKYENHPMWKGQIAGRYSEQGKLDTLKKYRFCICFENTHTIPGYITEKIFDAFAAGCVPIYWGPGNIEKYIPKSCFIDYRKFKNKEQMYRRISSMSEAEYGEYIQNISTFLKSKKAYLFSKEYFAELLLDAVVN